MILREETIPVSLSSERTDWDLLGPFKALWAKLKGRPIRPTDSEYDGFTIELAMQMGRSRTGEVHRGKGLPAIDSIIDLCDEGYVAIRSRRGEYLRHKGKEPVITNRVSPLDGTMIFWRLTLRDMQ
jgi:hypothetical protein